MSRLKLLLALLDKIVLWLEVHAGNAQAKADKARIDAAALVAKAQAKVAESDKATRIAAKVRELIA